MKNYLSAILFTCLLGVMISCSGGGDSKEKQTGIADKKAAMSALSQTTDPVCNMELSADNLADTCSVDGKVYGFCNSKCKEQYLANVAAGEGNTEESDTTNDAESEESDVEGEDLLKIIK